KDGRDGTRSSAEDLTNGSSLPKLGRGRPKGSTKRKVESLDDDEADEGSPATPRKRGRPKGSLNVKPKLDVSGNGEEGGSLMSEQRKRPGRPRKYPLPPPEERNKPKVWKPLGEAEEIPRCELPRGGS
uniref:Uncharacterized protein n=1 Tax=Takifugu rubripes TaxID=31033 RepID=A0A674PL98_TAKRU